MYYNLFESQNIPFDIICVDKYGSLEKKPTGTEKIYQFPLNFKKSTNKLVKLMKYISFRRYASKIIKRNQYSRIIVWGTETAILFSTLLSSNKYVLNIRDYANSDRPVIKNVLKKIINNSYFTTISSRGFEKFLPKHDYFLLNSFDKNFLRDDYYKFIPRNKPIRISFIGSVRFFDIDKKVLDIFANDDRFRIQFFGVGSEKLKIYAKENSIRNVKFHGSFIPEDTPSFIRDSDIINNLYGFDNMALDTATSLKYFFSLYFKKPILVFEGTYMETLTKDIGYVVPRKLPESLPSDIYEWYISLNSSEFEFFIEEKINNIEDENKKLLKKTLTLVMED